MTVGLGIAVILEILAETLLRIASGPSYPDEYPGVLERLVRNHAPMPGDGYLAEIELLLGIVHQPAVQEIGRAERLGPKPQHRKQNQRTVARVHATRVALRPGNPRAEPVVAPRVGPARRLADHAVGKHFVADDIFHVVVEDTGQDIRVAVSRKLDSRQGILFGIDERRHAAAVVAERIEAADDTFQAVGPQVGAPAVDRMRIEKGIVGPYRNAARKRPASPRGNQIAARENRLAPLVGIVPDEYLPDRFVPQANFQHALRLALESALQAKSLPKAGGHLGFGPVGLEGRAAVEPMGAEPHRTAENERDLVPGAVLVDDNHLAGPVADIQVLGFDDPAPRNRTRIDRIVASDQIEVASVARLRRGFQRHLEPAAALGRRRLGGKNSAAI